MDEVLEWIKQNSVELPPEAAETLRVLADEYGGVLRHAGFDLRGAGAESLLERFAAETARIHVVLLSLAKAVEATPADAGLLQEQAGRWLTAIPAVWPLLERLAEQEPNAEHRTAVRAVLEHAKRAAWATPAISGWLLTAAPPELRN